VADAQGGGQQLANILKLHVVGAAARSSDLSDGQVVTTLNGDLTVNIDAEGVRLTSGGGSARVVAADIEATNGVIHVIDAVLLPAAAPAPKSLIETAQAAGTFTTLIAAVQAAGLVDALSGAGPLTVFAPTDEAFAALPAGTVDALVADAQGGGQQLANILKLHVVGAAARSSDLSDGQVVTTLNGDLTVNIDAEGVRLTSGGGSARVVAADVEATNGVIHVIDAVLLPAP